MLIKNETAKTFTITVKNQKSVEFEEKKLLFLGAKFGCAILEMEILNAGEEMTKVGLEREMILL